MSNTIHEGLLSSFKKKKYAGSFRKKDYVQRLNSQVTVFILILNNIHKLAQPVLTLEMTDITFVVPILTFVIIWFPTTTCGTLLFSCTASRAN